jgi:hypothetical protein
MGFNAAVCNTLRKVLSSHTSYRAYVPYKGEGIHTRELPWRDDFSNAGMMLSQLIEDAAFGVHYDGVLKQVLKYRTSAVDALHYGALGRGPSAGLASLQQLLHLMWRKQQPRTSHTSEWPKCQRIIVTDTTTFKEHQGLNGLKQVQ